MMYRLIICLSTILPIQEIIGNPKQWFDVMLTEICFGGILSDEANVIVVDH